MSEDNRSVSPWADDDGDFFQHDPEYARCQETLDNLDVGPERDANDFTNRRREYIRATQYQIPQSRDFGFGEPVNPANLDEFGKELKRLDIEIRILNRDENILFTGNQNVTEIVEKINRSLGEINKAQKFTRLVQEFLRADEWNFNLLSVPMQSNLGVQDTFLRALLLSKPFQSLAFNVLLSKIDKIGRSSSSENLNELGQRCIAHLRYIDQIYDTKVLFDVIFEKQISYWNSPLRESFIEILPEIFVDQGIHHDVLVRLYTMVIESNLQNAATFRQSIFASMSLFVTDNPVVDKICVELLSRIMDFEPIVIREIINFVLNSTRRTDNNAFKTFLLYLRKYLNFSRLNKSPEDHSAESIDEIVAGIFEIIAAYIRVNVSKAIKDFQVCLTTTNLSSIVTRGRRNGNENRENDDTNECDEEIDNQLEDGANVPPDVFGVENDDDQFVPKQPVAKRDLDALDIFLLFVIQNVKTDPKLTIATFKSQLTSNNRENTLLETMEKVLNYKKFNLTFFSSILQVSYDLISAESEVSKLGGFILKHLFLVLPNKGKEIIEHFLMHLNEIDSEATLCLDVLMDIINNHPRLLFPYLDKLNSTLDNLHTLRLKNCRQLFFTLSVLSWKWNNDCCNFHGPQQNKDSGSLLKKKINEFLNSPSDREKIWGVIGTLMQIKALLQQTKSNVEKKIKVPIDCLKENIASNCIVRAEFFFQLGQLIGTKDDLPLSTTLCGYGRELFQEFRERFYKHKGNVGDHVSASQFEAPKFLNKNTKLWLDTNELVLSSNYSLINLDGVIVEVVPMLTLLKNFTKYEHNLYSRSRDSVAMNNFYTKFFFVLESNISLSRLASSDASQETRNTLLMKCHILYFVIEYIRTVLNMFAQYRNEELPTNECILRKFELLLECQAQMIQCVKQLGDYTLPNLSHVLPYAITVQYREKSEVTKIKRQMRMLNSITENAATAIEAIRDRGAPQQGSNRNVKQEVLDNSSAMDHCNENQQPGNNATTHDEGMDFESPYIDQQMTEEPFSSEAPNAVSKKNMRNSRSVVDEAGVSESQVICASGDARIEDDANINFEDEVGDEDDPANISMQILKKKLKKACKSYTISVDQLIWHFTPFNLEAVARLFELVRLKRRQTALLIENLSVILKKIFPPANKRKVPVGFGKTSVTDVLIQETIMGQGNTREEIWTILLQILPILFDILNHCAMNFRQNTAQSASALNEDLDRELSNIMRYALQIFCQIFQSSDMQSSVNDIVDMRITDEDSSNTKNCRSSVINILAEKISEHNLSNQPLNIEASSIGFRNESRTSVEQEESLVDYFIEIGHLVPNIASANTVLQIFLTLNEDFSDIHLQKIYELSLFFLSKGWYEPDQDSSFQKHYVEILNNYLNLRAEDERLNAIHWLIVNQLNNILPEQSRRAKCQDEPSKDRDELVANYAQMHFPFFNKKTFSQIHKLIFQRLNLFVAKNLCTETAKKMNTAKLVELWCTTAQCFFYLVINIRVKELRSLPFLQNCVREGRKFIAQFCSKSCSFKAILNKNKVGLFTQQICYIIRQIQLGNRLIQDVSIYAKAVKFTSILKLLPDLRATSELFLREIHSALVTAGLEDVMKIGFLKQRNIDGKNINTEADAFGAAKKQSVSRKRANESLRIAPKMEPVDSEENNENCNIAEN